MRVVTWLVLVTLSVLSVLAGRLSLALVFAAAKAVLLGLEFMELRHAARLHAAAYVLFVAVVVAVLEVLAR